MAALASTPAHTACTASLENAFSKNVRIRGSCARSFAPRTTVSFPAARTSGAALTCSRSQYAAAPGISTARAPQMQVICSAAAEGERTQRQPRFGGREDDGLEERVVQIKRVTKVVKGGKQLNFRAVVVVGDMNGRVGVGVAKAKEVITAVQNAVKDGKKHLEAVTVVKGKTFAHRADGRFGSAHVMLRPAGPGTGIIAGGAVRTVLELAGYENGFGKQLGSTNPLNNARATVEGLKLMKTHKMVAEERGIDVKELYW